MEGVYSRQFAIGVVVGYIEGAAKLRQSVSLYGYKLLPGFFVYQHIGILGAGPSLE